MDGHMFLTLLAVPQCTLVAAIASSYCHSINAYKPDNGIVISGSVSSGLVSMVSLPSPQLVLITSSIICLRDPLVLICVHFMIAENHAQLISAPREGCSSSPSTSDTSY